MSEIRRTPAFCTQCRSRCGCIAITQGERLLGIEPMPGHPSGERLCPKGKAAPELVHHPDRLTRPLRRRAPKGATDPAWEPMEWDEALDQIAARMGSIRDEHGAEQVAFSVTTPSGTHMSDGIAWVERFLRGFGSPNAIYGTEICNWHKDYASRFTYGFDIGTPDFAATDCVLLWGNNPAETWLARAVEIQKAMRRGARVVVVDPRQTVLARGDACWLRVRPGTDQALALGLAHLLIDSDRFNAVFMRQWTNASLLVRDDTGRLLRESDLDPAGSNAVWLAKRSDGTLVRYDPIGGRWLDAPGDLVLRPVAHIDTVDGRIRCRSAFALYAEAAAEFPPARVTEITGVPQSQLHEAAQILSSASSVAYYAWNGVGQSPIATQTDRAISLLYTLTGHYGARGGNVPGAAAAYADLSGADLLPATQLAKALGIAQRPLGPPAQGWVTARDVYRAVLDADPYPVRMLVSFGTNLLASQPDTSLARRALERLDFHVHADFFLNPSAQYADIVLPVATSWEREGLRTGFDASLAGLRRVQLRPAVIAPIAQARSDIDIVMGLARRLGMAGQFFDGDVDAGHDSMLAATGLSCARLRNEPEGVDVPGEILLRPFARLGVDGEPVGFPTPSRRIEVYSERLHEFGQPGVPRLDAADLPKPTADFPLRLGGAKSLVYCHSQHRHIASLRRLMPDPRIEISHESAQARGIADGDWVEVVTAVGRFVARARLSASVEPGSVFALHGWWIAGADGSPYADPQAMAANVNGAVDTSRADPVSGSIALRTSACEVRRLAGTGLLASMNADDDIACGLIQRENPAAGD